MHIITIDSPVNKLTLSCEKHTLTSIDFADSSTALTTDIPSDCKIIIEQLHEYFFAKRRTFTLPLLAIGTPFQQRVWQALLAIPYGETRSYGELARQLHTSARAIGNACRHNPIPIIIPCHRVVSQTSLGGYSGAISGNLLSIKQWLLTHEQ